MRRKSFAFLIALIFTFCFSLLLVGCKKDEQPAPSAPESHEEEIVIKEIKIAQPEVTEFSCTGDFISLDLGLTREELAALKIEGGVAVAPGEYTCRITLKDSVHYKLSDDSVTTIEWSIVQALVKKPTIVYDGTGDPRFEYGTVPTLAVEGYTGAALEEYLNRYFDIVGLDVQDVQPTQYNITINIKNGAYFKWDGVEEGHELDPVVISYFVIQKEINLPSPASKEFTYDGTLKSVISQIPQSIQSLLNIEGGEQTNAGDYTFTATLKNENNYKFSDGSETTFDWTINKATLYKPSIVSGTIQYESIPEFTVNGVEDAQAYLNYFTIPELTPQVVANEAYSVDIAITDTNNYKFSDDTYSVTLYYTVVKKQINVATPSLIFTYNGEEQGLDFALDEYLEGIVTLGGELLETNAGGYTATATINDSDNYVLVGEGVNEEGTIKTVVWTINKAPLTKPELVEGDEYHYTYGDLIDLIVDGVDDSASYISNYFDVVRPESNDASDEAYTITITIKSDKTANYKFADNAANVVLTYYIDKVILKLPELEAGEDHHFIYGEDVNIIVPDEEDIETYMATYFDVVRPESNDASDEAYTISITIKASQSVNFGWPEETESVELTYYIDAREIHVPAPANTEFYYTGEAITLDFGEDIAAYIESGVLSATGITQTDANGFSTTKFVYASNIAPLYFVLDGGNYYLTNSAFDVQGATLLAKVTNKNLIFVGETLEYFDQTTNEWKELVADEVEGHFTWTDGEETYYFALVDENYYLTDDTFEIDGLTALTVVTSKQIIYVGENNLEFLDASNNWLVLSTIRDRYNFAIELVDTTNYYLTQNSVVAGSWSISQTTLKLPELEAGDVHHFIYGEEVVILVDGEDDSAAYIDSYFDVVRPESNDASDEAYTITITIHDTANYKWPNEQESVVLHYYIDKKAIEIGEPEANEFTYTGSPISLDFGLSAEFVSVLNFEHGTETNSGDYACVITLVDTTNYYITDGSLLEHNWTINKVVLTKPTLSGSNDQFTYPNVPTLVVNGITDEQMMAYFDDYLTVVVTQGIEVKQSADDDSEEIGYQIAVQNASDTPYTITISIVDAANFCWTTEDADDVTINYTVVKKVIMLTNPTQTEFSYNGEEKIIDLRLSDEVVSLVTVEGDRETEAGDDYVCTITINDTTNYIFNDDSTYHEYPWKINRFVTPLTPFFDPEADFNALDWVYSTTLTYTGEEQNLDLRLGGDVLPHVIITTYVRGGSEVVEAINAGDYTSVITLDGGYAFPYVQNSLTIDWRMEKQTLEKPTILASNQHVGFGNVPTFTVVGQADGNAYVYTYFDVEWPTIANAREEAYPIEITIHDPANYEWADGAARVVLYYYVDAKEIVISEAPETNAIAYTGERVNLDFGYLGTEYNNVLEFIYTKHDTPSVNYLIYKNGSNFIYFDGTAWRMLVNVSENRFVSVKDLVYLNSGNVEWFDGTTWQSLTQVTGTHYVNMSNLVYDNGASFEWFNGTWHDLINVSGTHYVDKTNLVYENNNTVQYFDGTGWVTLVNVDGTHYINKSNLVVDDSGTVKYFDGTGWKNLIEVAENHYVSATNLIYFNETNYEFFDGTGWKTLVNVDGTHYVNKTNLVLDDSGTIKYFDGTSWTSLVKVSENHYLNKTNLVYDNGATFEYFDGSAWNTLINVGGTHYVNAINLIWNDNGTYKWFDGTAWNALTVDELDSTHFTFDDGENVHYIVIDSEHSSYFVATDDTFETASVNLTVVDSDSAVINFVIDDEHSTYYKTNGDYSETVQEFAKVADKAEVIYFVIDETPEQEAYYISNSSYSSTITTLEKVESANEVIYFVIDETPESEAYYIANSEYSQSLTTLTKVLSKAAVMYFVVDDENEDYFVTDSTYTDEVTLLEKVADESAVIYFVINDEFSSYYITDSTYTAQTTPLQKVLDKNEVNYFVLDDEHTSYYISNSDYSQQVSALGKVNAKTDVIYFVIDDENNLFYLTDSNYLNRIAMQTKVNSKANAVTFFIIDEANELYYITSNGTSTDVVLALLFQPGIDPVNVGEYDCLVVLKSTGNIPNNYYIGEECLTQFTLTIYQGVLDQPVIDGETNHVTYGEALPALTIEGMESEQAAAYIAEFFDVTYDSDVNAGNHDITVSIKDGHQANRSFGEDEQTGEKIYTITIPYVIDRATVDALSNPSELSFTYDGTAKSVNFSDVIGENPYEVTITGATATYAGSYTAVATLGGNWQFDTEVYTQNFNWTINKGTYDGDTTFENYEFRLEVSNSQEAAYVMIDLSDDPGFWGEDNDWEYNTNLNSSNLEQTGMANNNFYGVYVPPKRYFYATEDEELKFYYQDTEKYYLRLCVYDNQAEDYVTQLPAALETSIVLTSVAVGKGSNLTPQDIATTRAELTYIDGVGYMVNLNGIGGCGDRNVQIGVRVSVQDSNHVTKTVDYLFTIKLVWIGPY